MARAIAFSSHAPRMAPIPCDGAAIAQFSSARVEVRGPSLSRSSTGSSLTTGRSCCWSRPVAGFALAAAMTFFPSSLRRAGRQNAVRRRQRRATARAATAREPQVLPFIDPATGSEVVLIACMHFNPHSVAKAAGVTRNLVEKGELSALVVESCPSRWKKVEDVQKPGTSLRIVLDNEMQAAAEIAESAGCTVILGDQRIEDLMSEMSSLGKIALSDLASPLDGGWMRTGSDLLTGVGRLGDAKSKKRASTTTDTAPQTRGAEDSIGLQDLDFGILLGSPLAVVRYFLSIAFKAPLLFAGIVTFFAIFNMLPNGIFTDFLGVSSEVVLLRVLLGALLRDRDAILAKSICAACQVASKTGRSVVAVLGAAHCNGVKKHIMDGTAPDEPAAAAA
mmetsp:Transcript_56798/g.102012  ORF Transcript_56798/g.102012 Transcript_56798/m.102012 type:complete len:392 (+) Transcript_56798:50-1225(+)